MARPACVSVPALPLQWLVQRHPDWREAPAAVVADDRAQSPILWINERARRKGIRRGMRHAAALALAGELRAGTVPASEVAAQVRALTQCLQGHSPHVEPCREEPGVFWVEAEGLQRLHPDLRAWAGDVQAALQALGYTASVVVGHGRFTSYALARTQRGVAVYRSVQAERRASLQVPLERLGAPPVALDGLQQLGILTIRDVLRLPAVGVLQRFGPELYRLHRLASGAFSEALQPSPEELPIEQALLLDYPESDAVRLLFLIKGLLPPLLEALRARQQALKALHLRLTLEGQRPREATLRPAAATRDINLLSDLLRLRLETLPLEGGVNGLNLLAEGELRELTQLPLFPVKEQRSLEAANRALARVRAEFGEQAVVRAVLRNGHLPEARFAWEPLARVQMPKVTEQPAPSLVRRVFQQPVALAGLSRIAAPQGLQRLLGGGAILRTHGPFPLSGAWWSHPEHRDYAFLETESGAVFWVYRDRERGQWFLQGRVE